MPKNKNKIYLISTVILVVVIVILLFLISRNSKTRFVDAPDITYEGLCEKNGDMWMEMQPFKDGKAISLNKCIGCMIDTNHFCFREEYINYIKQTTK